MDHAFGVRGRQRIGDLLRKIQRAIERHLRIFFDDVLQILAIDIRHRDEAQRPDVTHVMDTENVFVGNFAGENEFLLEPLQRVALADGAFAHNFDRDGPVQFLVVGLIDAAHAALAEKAVNPIPGTEVTAGSNDGRIDRLHGDIVPHGHGRATVGAGLGEIRIDRCAVRTIHAETARKAEWCATEENYRVSAQGLQGVCLTDTMSSSEKVLRAVDSVIRSAETGYDARNSYSFLGRVFRRNSRLVGDRPGRVSPQSAPGPGARGAARKRRLDRGLAGVQRLDLLRAWKRRRGSNS